MLIKESKNMEGLVDAGVNPPEWNQIQLKLERVDDNSPLV